MNASATAPLSVLRFWRDLEVFNIPTAPSAKDSSDQVKIVTLRRGDVLPWQHPHFQPTQEHGYVHIVYVGVADTEDLSRLMLQSVFPEEDLSERERQRATGNGWLAAFVANEDGHPKLDSYLPASFAHGVDALWHSEPLENINARLARATDEFGQRRHHLRPVATDAQQTPPTGQPDTPPAPNPLTWGDLDEELRAVCKLLGPGADAAGLDWRVVVRVSRVKRRFLDDSLNAAIDYLNSFYLDDLNRLITQGARTSLLAKP